LTVTRKRLSHEESRNAALAAASTILLADGPQAVTLKAVSARIGRTHANLLHHFGSVAELQKALAIHLADNVCESIAEAVRARREGLVSPVDVVNLIFEAFEAKGAGSLANWMLVTGNRDALNPAISRVHEMLAEFVPAEQGECEQQVMHRLTLALVLLALGDSLLGDNLSRALAVPRDASRIVATELLSAHIARRDAAGLSGVAQGG
jgi:AcrR family transcriptional regulator